MLCSEFFLVSLGHIKFIVGWSYSWFLLTHVSRRAVLVKESEESGDKPIDVTPEGFAVRSSAQEYGGGSFTVSRNMVIFSNYKDQRLYKQFIGGEFHNLLLYVLFACLHLLFCLLRMLFQCIHITMLAFVSLLYFKAEPFWKGSNTKRLSCIIIASLLSEYCFLKVKPLVGFFIIWMTWVER